MAEKELEDQLTDTGNRLLNLPPSAEDALTILDLLESYLSRVEQSPSQSMQDALCPSMKALVTDELLKHSDSDVKVAVASCISEVTRITAPEAPYDDGQMKEIFQLIVGAFEKLFDMSSRSYYKRVSILETVAKVRSCVVMLDLECDTLVIQMFHHFLKSVRDFHLDKVFSSMETIMTLVLEESEDISLELLSPLLNSVKKENQDVLPIARKLGEKVLGNCTAKLKPFLIQALRSMGVSLNDYSEIVASICQGVSDTVEEDDVNSSGEHLADENKLSEKTGSDELPQVAEELKSEVLPGEVDPGVEKSPKMVTSNGSAQTENNDSLIGLDSLKKNPELSRGTTQGAEAEPDSLVSYKVVKSETKKNQASKKKRGRKPNSSMHSAEASVHSRIESDKEPVDLPEMRKSGSKEANNSLSEDPTISETAVPSVHGKEILTQVSPQTITHDETLKVDSPSPNRSLTKGTRPKGGRLGRKKKVNTNQDTDPGLPSEPKGALSIDQLEDEAPPSADVISKNDTEGNSEVEAKSHRRSSKKVFSVKANVDRTPLVHAIKKKESGAASDSEARKKKVKTNQDTDPGLPSEPKGALSIDQLEDEAPPSADVISKSEKEGISEVEAKSNRRSSKKVFSAKANEDRTPLVHAIMKKESGATSDSEAKPLKQSGKKIDAKGKPLSGGKTISEKVVTGESSIKKMVSSPKSAAKSINKDKSHFEETPTTKSKRKRTSGKGETTETPHSVKDFGENLVGSKIKVWWPRDEMFYEGIVDSFDPIKRKHKVSYTDGDVEILMLKKERWEFVGETVPDGEQATDLPSPDVSSEMPPKKKVKANSVSPTKQAKTDASIKRGKGTSTSKSKGEATKSISKFKDDSKLGSGTTDGIPKTASKTKDDIAGKSKVDTPRTSSKLKDDTQKTVKNSKDVTLKTATRSKSDAPKSDPKSKSNTPRSGSKSKSEPTKTGNKSSANGISVKGKTGTSKVQESGDSAKGKLLESVKAKDVEAKGGKLLESAKAKDVEAKSGKLLESVKAKDIETKSGKVLESTKAKDIETKSGKKRLRRVNG